MTQEEKYTYWFHIAQYDLESAEAMLKAGRYAYVCFMCQQSLEKIAKGLYNFYIDDNVPRVHNISFILRKTFEKLGVDADDTQYRLFDTLAAYYIQGRYPTFKSKIAQLVNDEQASFLYSESREVYEWLRSLKK